MGTPRSDPHDGRRRDLLRQSDELLEDVELLRRTVIAARDSDDQEREAARLVTSWTIDRAEQVARAFTCYFQLINLAEERHRARALRERDRSTAPLAESLAEAV